uniref:Protein kinase domain-containing protein n=1 Tax=Leersia perrieri TaxID=77586 RepID=A0A0D9XCN7_9ORYZ
MGYIDPEFVNSHRLSTESDVYSFVVVLLEIACGRRLVSSSRRPKYDAPTLLNFVRGMYDRGMVMEAANGRLNGEFNERQMERVLVTGLWCTCHDATCRPSIAQAMEALRSEGAELPMINPATHAAEHSMVECAYGDLSDEFSVVTPTTAYLTSRDSTYLLVHAEE